MAAFSWNHFLLHASSNAFKNLSFEIRPTGAKTFACPLTFHHCATTFDADIRFYNTDTSPPSLGKVLIFTKTNLMTICKRLWTLFYFVPSLVRLKSFASSSDQL